MYYYYNNIIARVESGQTVLHVASQKGKTDIVEKLLEAGAENSEDNSQVLNIHTK
jgi:ankyrin repeat protein